MAFRAPSAFVLALVCVVAGCQTAAPRRLPQQIQLAEALREADRVVVNVGVTAAAASPTFEKRSPTVGVEFLAAVGIDELAGEFHCECAPPHTLQFLRGQSEIAKIEVRSARWLRWVGGPWTSDAVIAGEAGVAYQRWLTTNGGIFWQLVPATQAKEQEAAKAQLERTKSEFIASFPKAAEALVRWEGALTKEGFQPWIEHANLRELVPDNIALARAAFRAFGVHPSPWTVDDYRTAAIQSALVELPREDFQRALETSAADDRALRGAARLYFRLGLHKDFAPAFNGRWLPQLASAVLRTAERRDQAIMLAYLADTHEPAAREFLRSLATGERVYPWPVECTLGRQEPHEPSLVASAAVLLALWGDTDAPRLAQAAKRPVPGLDAAAADIAETLINPRRPLPGTATRYPSHVLGFAAAEALARQNPRDVSAAALAGIRRHEDSWVRQRVWLVVAALGVDLVRDSEVNLYAAPVEQSLATENPAEAIRQCTERMPRANRHDRTALLLIRAVAYEAQNNALAAIADYEEALQRGNYSPEVIHRKLAWLKFGQGRFADARKHADAALRTKPDAELYFLRAMVGFVNDDFGPETELNFTTAMSLAPEHGYATIYQHLTCLLGSRLELSRLQIAQPRPRDPSAPVSITVAPRSLVFDLGLAANVPWWPNNVLKFYRGEITAAELLKLAQPNPPTPTPNLCEANFYIAQLARVANDAAAERTALEAAVATQADGVVEFQLAKLRLAKLSKP